MNENEMVVATEKNGNTERIGYLAAGAGAGLAAMLLAKVIKKAIIKAANTIEMKRKLAEPAKEEVIEKKEDKK